MSGDLKERVEELLVGLGRTSDEVADALRAKGIRGNVSDGECCPVANLIAAEFEEAAAGQWGVEKDWFVDLGFIRTPDGLVPTPGPIKSFIAVFDDGETIYDDEEPYIEHPYADLEYVVDEDEAEAAGAEQ